MDEHRDSPPLQLPGERSVSSRETSQTDLSRSQFSLPWLSSVLVGLSAAAIALVTSLFALIVAMVISLSPAEMTKSESIEQWMNDLATSPASMWVLVLPGQLTFMVLSIVGGMLSREPLRRRLGLQRGRLPTWQWGILAMATPCIGYASGWLLELSPWQPSEHLLELEKMIGNQRDGQFLGMLFLVAIVPGICEELLFRGYVQSRLTRVWPVGAGLIFSSVCFALAHLDPMHVIMVFPIGLWLGIVAWRSGCIWPAMLGHVANNGTSVLLTHSTQYPDGMPGGGLLMIVSAGCLLVSILLLLFSRTTQQTAAPLPTSAGRVDEVPQQDGATASLNDD